MSEQIKTFWGYTTIVLALLLLNNTSMANDETNVGNDEPVLGQGEFRYQHQPQKLKLPESILSTWGHAHGLTSDKEGNIYLTYTTSGKLNEDSFGLVVFDRKGEFISGLGDHDIARGTPHGLEGRYENGAFMLYHSNNDGRLFKTDSKGNIIWQTNSHKILPNYNLRWLQSARDSVSNLLYKAFNYDKDSVPGEYMPCNLAFHPDGKTVFMADCYGRSFLHAFSSDTGEYLEKSFGGFGSETGKYNEPHGLIYDERLSAFAIADRSNHRIQYTDVNGKTVSILKDQAIDRPCDLDVRGDYMLVSDLSGHLTILDKTNSVISKVALRASYEDTGVVHHHDAVFLKNHDVVVATQNPATITYWKRVE